MVTAKCGRCCGNCVSWGGITGKYIEAIGLCQDRLSARYAWMLGSEAEACERHIMRDALDGIGPEIGELVAMLREYAYAKKKNRIPLDEHRDFRYMWKHISDLVRAQIIADQEG